MSRALLLISLCMLQCSILTAGSFKTRLSAEGGIYHSSSRLISQEYLLSRLDLSANYTFVKPRLKFNMSSRLRPEMYLSSSQNLSTKFDVATALQFQPAKRFSTQIGLSYQSEQLAEASAGIRVYELGTRLAWRMSSRFISSVQIKAIGSEFELASSTEIDALNLAMFLEQRFRRSIKLSYAFHIGSYRARDPILSLQSWRLGPQLGLSYRKSFSLDLTYRLLALRLQDKLENGVEHYFQLVAGKIVTSKWSIFLLAEGYFRDFSDTIALTDAFLFLPSETENRFHIKLERDISDKTSFYIKSGYQRSDLLLRDVRFAGLQAVIGITYRH
ncbi:MAG: hypothetical protein ACRBF0_08745 [Calditrichia bacterium]